MPIAHVVGKLEEFLACKHGVRSLTTELRNLCLDGDLTRVCDTRNWIQQVARNAMGETMNSGEMAHKVPRQVFNKAGFTLLELMIVTAIFAILTSVAIPAYHNYIDRTKQTEAVDALMQAQMDQDVFWAENFRYAGSIGCLPSFGNNCGITSFPTANSYRISIPSAGTSAYRVVAQKSVNGQLDLLHVSNTTARPVVDTPDALKWSIFRWLFN